MATTASQWSSVDIDIEGGLEQEEEDGTGNVDIHYIRSDNWFNISILMY